MKNQSGVDIQKLAATNVPIKTRQQENLQQQIQRRILELESPIKLQQGAMDPVALGDMVGGFWAFACVISQALRSFEERRNLWKFVTFVTESLKATRRETPLRRQRYVDGSLHGTNVQAFPDNGADRCAISPKLVSKLELSPQPGTEETFRLPNGKHICSPGVVYLPWKFAGEEGTHNLPCWIVPGCVHDLVLDSTFLEETQTLTKFSHRIKSKIVRENIRQRVCLLGDVKQRLAGNLDGYQASALADTGSDVLLMSGAYARKRGFNVDRSPKNRVELEFINGSTDVTEGIVRNVTWEVGGRSTKCDFYVLESLCEDIILNETYLSRTNAFVNHADYFFDVSRDHDSASQLCTIRRIGKFSKPLDLLELEYMKDGKFKSLNQIASSDYRDLLIDLSISHFSRCILRCENTARVGEA